VTIQQNLPGKQQMPKKWVVKASPLIVLARISHPFLLRHVAEELVVPAGVGREIAQGPEDDSARQWLLAHVQELVREARPLRVEVSVVVIPRIMTRPHEWRPDAGLRRLWLRENHDA
jgi:hypothetical protein